MIEMNVNTLLGNFEVLAEAPDGIEKLRELILRLAAEGLLIDPSLSENEVVDLIASYNKLYKISLYDDISNEWSTSWNSVWLAIKRLNPNVSKFRVGTQMA